MKPVTKTSTQFDCQTCGVCCVGMIVPVDAADQDRLMARFGPLVALRLTCAVPRTGFMNYADPDLAMTQVEHPDGSACIAFRGQVGSKCSCSIYRHRPNICREIEPGGKACRVWRELHEEKRSA